MLIEFKLHNGKVPYFVKSYLNYKVQGLNSTETIKDRYLGITVNSKDNYVPTTIVELTSDQFIAQFSTAIAFKLIEGSKVELNKEEKEQIAIDFLEGANNGQI